MAKQTRVRKNPRRTKKPIDTKDGMEYEESGNVFNFHLEEQGSNFIDSLGDIWGYCLHKFGQGVWIVDNHFRANNMIYGVFIFLTSIWLSGWLASAGKSFWSLMSVVVGFVLLVVTSLIGSKK